MAWEIVQWRSERCGMGWLLGMYEGLAHSDTCLMAEWMFQPSLKRHRHDNMALRMKSRSKRVK